jgi:eukaryotic-like serine/threonine-protein kinase
VVPPPPPSHTEPSRRIGEMLSNRYRLVSIIGEGGQGVVYRADDVKDREPVAIKILRDETAADPSSRERMFREAQALSTLLGTAAVHVFDQGWTMDGAHFLVMELLTGQDFEDVLRTLERDGGRIPIPQLLELLLPVVQTLERAHAAGIVHRDLKPANIFLLNTGQVRLLDFGFAKFTRLRGLTMTGFIAGSPSYIAPEIWSHGSSDIDQRADIYSLGAVIFRAISGKPPFVGSTIVGIYRSATKDPRPKLTTARPELSPEIDDWVEQALAADPDARFLSVTALYNALLYALGLAR